MKTAVVAMAVLLSGCGTLFSGTTQQVTLVGVPRDADVFVDGVNVGGQRQLSLKRGKTHAVLAQKSGCQDGYATVGQSVNGVSVLNLLCLLCWGVDAATGALWTLDDQVAVHQDCREPTPPQPAMMSPVQRDPWVRPATAVTAPAASPPPAARPAGCEPGWYTTPRGYCCPLGYDDSGNGTCNPSRVLVDSARP